MKKYAVLVLMLTKTQLRMTTEQVSTYRHHQPYWRLEPQLLIQRTTTIIISMIARNFYA